MSLFLALLYALILDQSSQRLWTSRPLHPRHHMTERKEAVDNVKNLILSVFILTFGYAVATGAQEVNKLLTKPLPEAPGKEIEVITVDYAPGAVDTMHRHDAHAVVYVLEGEIEMQLRGGALQRLVPGQVFYESPQDVHTVSRNASKTKRAKFVVFFVKNQEAPILTPTGFGIKTPSDASLFSGPCSIPTAFREPDRFRSASPMNRFPETERSSE